MPELISPEVECLKLKAALNESWRLSQQAAKDAVDRAIQTGGFLCRWKELLEHGKFEVFVEKHFEGSLRNAQVLMKVAKGLTSLPKSAATALLTTEDSLNGIMRRLKKDKPKKISAKGSPGGGLSPSSTVPPAPETGETADSSGEDERTDSQGSEPVKETDPRPPRSGKDKAGGYMGKCPNCAGSKWTAEGFCAKCNQPFGEPVGDRTEADPASDHRAKTTKALEAAMRGFDDLNLILPKAGAHKQVIELCKNLLKSAKGWK